MNVREHGPMSDDELFGRADMHLAARRAALDGLRVEMRRHARRMRRTAKFCGAFAVFNIFLLPFTPVPAVAVGCCALMTSCALVLQHRARAIEARLTVANG